MSNHFLISTRRASCLKRQTRIATLENEKIRRGKATPTRPLAVQDSPLETFRRHRFKDLLRFRRKPEAKNRVGVREIEVKMSKNNNNNSSRKQQQQQPPTHKKKHIDRLLHRRQAWPQILPISTTDRNIVGVLFLNHNQTKKHAGPSPNESNVCPSRILPRHPPTPSAPGPLTP